MSVVHLATHDGILCPTSVTWHVNLKTTGDLAAVTCHRCTQRIASTNEDESSAAADRRYLARMEADCRAIGIGHLWDAIDDTDAAGRLIRDLLGSLAGYFAETARQENAA